jgi:DNA-binding response OmpR family regulator
MGRSDHRLPEEAPLPGTVLPMAPPTTVLLVEDDPVILKLLEVNFELEGYSVLLAHDGAEGIELARSSAPDLIISDIMMPNVSGLELVKALKGDDATKGIPIILLSAKAQTADIRAGMEAGADDYVTKPFEPLELVEHVQALLAR